MQFATTNVNVVVVGSLSLSMDLRLLPHTVVLCNVLCVHSTYGKIDAVHVKSEHKDNDKPSNDEEK